MKLVKRIFCLPFLPTILIALPCFALVIYTLTANNANPILCCISYALSAYALAIVTTLVVRMAKGSKGSAKNLPAVKKLYDNPISGRYLTDRIFRAKVNLFGNLIINFGYILLNAITGILNGSEWLITLAIYYFLLSVMRVALLQHFSRKPIGKELQSEYKRYRLCGVLLLFMNGALAAIVARIVNDNEGAHYGEIMIYVMAMYAFYAVTIAIVNLVRYRRFGSPVLSAVKVVSLTSALVSMLSLETAMLEQFGAENSEQFRVLMTSFTGGGICAAEIGIAIFMIAKANKKLKEQEQQNGQQINL